MKSLPLGMTYDDVLLVPQFSAVKTRRDVDCSTLFARQIPLAVPFVSANMDTVTESRMAITVAELGGIGVIHRFLPVSAQVDEVMRVKRYQGNVVEDPVTVSPGSSVGEASHLMLDLDISGLPVVDEEMKLFGIITSRDIKFTSADTLVTERMTPRDRLVVAPYGIAIGEASQILMEHRLEKLPLVDDEDKLVGLITAKDLSMRNGSPQSTRDDKGRLRVAAAVGVIGDFLERAEALAAAGVDALVIDIAHGDSAQMLAALGQLRESFGAMPIVAGNVATAEGVERLAEAGADAVKVGVGPGSVCITRQVAGTGVPQFTAVMECAEAVRKHDVPVIADGGIRYSGDVAKAIGAGASSVMLGNLLAGTDESPSVAVNRNGRKVKISRGMASTEAQVGRALRDDPLSGWSLQEGENDVAPEGVQAATPYRGPAREVLQQLLHGLRSGMSYSGAADIAQMWDKARFIRQTEAGSRESAPHDVFPG